MELEALEAILGEDGLLSACPSRPARMCDLATVDFFKWHDSNMQS
jgi:hypothetical protein